MVTCIDGNMHGNMVTCIDGNAGRLTCKEVEEVMLGYEGSPVIRGDVHIHQNPQHLHEQVTVNVRCLQRCQKYAAAFTTQDATHNRSGLI